MTCLSKEEGQKPFPQWAFIGFNLHRNTGHIAHQSLSGSNDQTIDNIQRTMRAYSESGSESQRAIKLWETNSFHAWTLIIEIENILSKAGFTGFYAFFVTPDAPRKLPFPAQGCTHLQHCFRLKSGGGCWQPRD